MQNKNYPQMFDDNLVEQEFLNSLEGIAKEPIREKLFRNMYIIPAVGFLLFFNDILYIFLSIKSRYSLVIYDKLMQIESATDYLTSIVEYLI
jgi:hypothetical protein|tara:strand:- start:2449 stop:2724 length:276 start_codon:yes stop_codon:yes gene_type:complete